MSLQAHLPMEVDTKAKGVAPAGKHSQELKDKFLLLFLAMLGFCCCTQAFPSCGKQGLLLLRSTGSRHAGFSSCGTRAQ